MNWQQWFYYRQASPPVVPTTDNYLWSIERQNINPFNSANDTYGGLYLLGTNPDMNNNIIIQSTDYENEVATSHYAVLDQDTLEVIVDVPSVYTYGSLRSEPFTSFEDGWWGDYVPGLGKIVLGSSTERVLDSTSNGWPYIFGVVDFNNESITWETGPTRHFPLNPLLIPYEYSPSPVGHYDTYNIPSTGMVPFGALDVRVNPFDNKMWATNAHDRWSLFRINFDGGNLNVVQGIYAVAPVLDVTSPFLGVPPSLINAGNPFVQSLQMDSAQLVFTGPDQIYVINNDNYGEGGLDIFKINTVDSSVRYQFTIKDFNPTVAVDDFSGHRGGSTEYLSVYFLNFDSVTNTMWFSSGRTTFAWTVGSHPDTIVATHQFKSTLSLESQTLPGNQLNTYSYSDFTNRSLPGQRGLVSNINNGHNFIFGSLGGDRKGNFEIHDLLTSNIVGVVRPTNDFEYYATWGNTCDLYNSKGWIYNEEWFIEEEGGFRIQVARKTTTPRIKRTARYVKLDIVSNVFFTHHPADDNSLGEQAFTENRPLFTSLQRVDILQDDLGTPATYTAVASSENPSFPASNLANPEIANELSRWQANELAQPVSITFDFGSAVPLEKIRLYPRNSVDNTITTDPNYLGRAVAPGAFKLYVSTDNVIFDVVGDYSLAAWNPGIDSSQASGYREFPLY